MRPWEPLQSLNSLSVTKISELSKFSKAYISQVKHGKCPPSKKLLKALSSYERSTQTEIDYFNLFMMSRQSTETSETISLIYFYYIRGTNCILFSSPELILIRPNNIIDLILLRATVETAFRLHDLAYC